MDVLVAVDMQNDFITGALGSKEALEILPAVIKRIKSFRGRVLFKGNFCTLEAMRACQIEVI